MDVMNKGISVKRAKELREEFDFSHIIILGFTKEGERHVATHGETKSDSESAATMGNTLKRNLGFPESQCNTEPLERICENCISLQLCPLENLNYHECVFEPMKAIRNSKDKACKNFEPNC